MTCGPRIDEGCFDKLRCMTSLEPMLMYTSVFVEMSSQVLVDKNGCGMDFASVLWRDAVGSFQITNTV